MRFPNEPIMDQIFHYSLGLGKTANQPLNEVARRLFHLSLKIHRSSFSGFDVSDDTMKITRKMKSNEECLKLRGKFLNLNQKVF